MICITLSKEEATTLKKVSRTEVGRVCERIHFVLLSSKGYRVPEIAELFEYSEDTIRTWLKRYEKDKLAGLQDKERSGRPPKDELIEAVVEAQIGQSPRCFGYLATFWTILSLTEHLATYLKIVVSPSTVRRAVKKIGYSWRRPRLDLSKKRDPDKKTRLAVIISLLKSVIPDCHILFQDESDVELLPILRAMWMRGEQTRIPTPGQNKRQTILGALDIRTGLWNYLISPTKRSTDFIALLEKLLVAYPSGMIILFVDHASIHKSKATQKWLAEHPRVHLVFLPKYVAAKFNPVEKIWWALKGTIAANYLYKDLAEIERVIDRFFDKLSPETALNLVDADGLIQRLQDGLLTP